MLKVFKKNNNNFLVVCAPLIICLITILIYYPSLNYPFQFDDAPNILKFFNIRNMNFKSLAFCDGRWICTWLNTLNFQIGKFEPLTYRILNLSFHILTGIFVYLFFYLALKNLKNNNFFKNNAFYLSLITTILFLLHPVQTQTVSYIIQGRLEGIATLFVISICLIYLLFCKTNNFILKIFLIFLLVVLTIFSTGTKEIAIVTPFLLMLTDWFFVAQGNFDSYKKRIPIHVLVLSLTFIFYLYVLKPKFFIELFGLKMSVNNNIGNILTKNINDKITPLFYLISEFKVILHYLFIFIWPFNISAEYDWKLNYNFFEFNVVIPFLILLSFFIFIIYLLKKNNINPIAFGLIWFFIAILPRASIIPSGELVADYKTYLASIGLLFLISILLLKFFYLLKKYLKRINMGIFLFIIVSLLSFGTYSRNLVWRSALEFWGDIIKKAEKSRAYNNYGVELSNQQRFNESIPYFKKAIKLDPYYWDPYTNLGSAYAIIGKMKLAIKTIQDSLSLNSNQPEAYNNLGTFLMYEGDYESAQEAFTSALALVPHYGKAMLNFGRLYLLLRDNAMAWDYFKKATTQSDFDINPEAYEFLGNTSISLKKFEEAIYAFKKMLSLSKELKQQKEALFNLANAYFLSEQLQQAIELFNQFVTKFPNDVRGWCNLIETNIQMKDYKKALELIKTAQLRRIYFPGIEIQQAKALAKLGYYESAIKVLSDFIEISQDTNLKDIAEKLISMISII